MRFMLSQSPAQVPVKYVSVQCKGGLLTVLYGTCIVLLHNLHQRVKRSALMVWPSNGMYLCQKPQAPFHSLLQRPPSTMQLCCIVDGGLKSTIYNATVTHRVCATYVHVYLHYIQSVCSVDIHM